MSAAYETAYPRFKSELTDKELDDIYTPNSSELHFARQQTNTQAERVFLLVQLKTCQRLGYFVKIADIPKVIYTHIAGKAHIKNISQPSVSALEKTGARHRLRQMIRKRLAIKPFDDDTTVIVAQSAASAAETLQELTDIINVVIEELVRQRIELPGFTTLLRAARHARNHANTIIFNTLVNQLDSKTKTELSQFLTPAAGEPEAGWQKLKREPKKPTNKEVRSYLEHLTWLCSWIERLPSVAFIPAAKWRQFILEARAFDVADLKRMKSAKRYTLIVILIHSQLRRAMDDTVTIVNRKVSALHNNAKLKLEQYCLKRTRKVDDLIGQFHDVLTAFNEGSNDTERIKGIHNVIGDKAEELVEECDQHMAYAGDNYIPFMVNPYHNQRPLLLNCLELLNVCSSSNDQSIVEACQFVLDNRNSRKATLTVPNDFSLHWLPDKWYKMMMGKSAKSKGKGITEINRKYFELCVLTQVAKELKTGDLFVVHSEDYNDYRDQLISWSQYEEEISDYTNLLDFPDNTDKFIEQLKRELTETASMVDKQFPDNEYVEINDEGLVIHKHEKPFESAAQKKLDQLITERLPEKNILDILIESENWLNLHKKFGPITGFDGKVAEPKKRFVSTLFCYGCNLGPVQTARSIKELSRKQVSWLNLRHISEQRLDKAIELVVNAYNKFPLPKMWGSGKHVAADGTKWNLYEQNLLSEYHIRYGGYGGIGYYHVSDMYIALFSHFIPCGVYEAIYILDGLMKNESDIQPDTVHGDTQSQSTPVFALAHLLGINLMPRIRKPKSLIFYRPDPKQKYEHIDALFGESINWSLIKTHLPDMLRIALSIKAGKITPSAILRRLGSKSVKNKLYFAFRELGRVIRTKFLLEYISDTEIRKTVQSATNKNEEFNNFAQWLMFGQGGVIAENLKFSQRKIIKYNHLVANLVTLHNVNAMTQVLNDLQDEGVELTDKLIAGLAPYRTKHINRLGDYLLNLARKIAPMSFRSAFVH